MFGIPERHFARYFEILSILVRHGFGYLLIPGNLNTMQEKNLGIVGVHLRKAFEELGAAFIKIGQIASTRSDLLPQPIIHELEKLQDRVPPLSFGIVCRVVEDSLESSMESVFKEFDPIPLAAASIGQVHRAVLHNGERVAVKVQRPFLRETVKIDLEIFQVIISRIEQRTQWGKRYPIRLIFEEFSETIKGELDFINEGKNAEKVSKSCKRKCDLVIPKIYWELTYPAVLTMEYISGIPLLKVTRETTHNTHRIADRLSKALLHQIFLDGSYHGDPHPGNILILPDDKIALIDFGISGHLSRSMRNEILSLVSGLVRGNDAFVLKTLSQMGIVADTVDRKTFQADIVALRHKHMDVTHKRFEMGESIQDFFDIIFRHGIHIPSEFVLLGKTLLTLEKTLKDLDPAISLLEQVKPISQKYIWKKLLLGNIWMFFRRG
ncbi:ABC1 kinase family protein [Desulfosporosinus nitroreducens]|uniref:ABC1 kinase family protein n=1 Tax=Desulfosporosinus nitroreducens TaxID=2018668 RepID=UPI00207CE32B|nr:AarF/UbiB family protein [Desulfosporosinus nitroreducens]MCO1602163.1 AarF/UbiB family protein [Desulfosporosinus nitroreducens]